MSQCRAPARPSPGVGLALPTDAEKASRTVPSGDLPLVKHLSFVLGSFTYAVETSRLSLDYLSEQSPQCARTWTSEHTSSTGTQLKTDGEPKQEAQHGSHRGASSRPNASRVQCSMLQAPSQALMEPFPHLILTSPRWLLSSHFTREEAGSSTAGTNGP